MRTEILPHLVQTVAHALKIPHVAIWLPAGANQLEPVVAWGEGADRAQTIPLVYQNEAIGPAPVPFSRLTAHSLASAIRTMTSDAGMQSRALRLRDAMAGENGVQRAVEIIQHNLVR